LRLHIGGRLPMPGWKILNIQPGPHVDFLCSCTDLSQFPDGSVTEIYASHVIEHLGYFHELPQAFGEFARVLKVGGVLRVGVPDLEVLARLMLAPGVPLGARFHVMRMIYGGQTDPTDFHRVGFTFEMLADMLARYCFNQFRRVESFGLCKDTSDLQMMGQRISLNVIAVRGAGTPPDRPAWVPETYDRETRTVRGTAR
jgi:predicted SAM-dependent methyltransferase